MPARLDIVLLLFLRVSALIFSSPIFGRRNIPNMVKIGFCAVITYLFFVEAVPADQTLVYANWLVYALLCVKELMFGLVMGYICNLFFTLTFTAGQLIDMQMGFGMVNILDVQSNISVPMIGNFLNIVILIVFFLANGHHRLIQILYVTVNRMPVGSVQLALPKLALVAAQLFSMAFLLAINVALPIIAAGLLGEAAMGLIIRSVPQLNVFSIGLPAKVLLGFVVLFFMVPVFVGFSNTIFNEMFYGLERMFAAFLG